MRAWLASRFARGEGSRRADLLAAVLLTVIAVPAGMGYAQVASLPAGVGLTASVVGLLVYAAVGPTPVFVVGPDSSLAPMIAATLVPLAAVGTDRRVALASVLAVMVGAILVAGGLLKLGLVADLLAKPIRIGFLNGVAVVIIAGQLPRAFDLTTDHDTVVPRGIDLVTELVRGHGDALAATLGALTAALWLALRPMLRAAALPTSILATTLLGAFVDAPERVSVIGRLRGGWALPDPAALRWSDFVTLLPAAGGIALVAFADSVALSRSLSDRRGTVVDESAEMRALGSTNVVVGLLGGFPISASSSRTPAALAAGASSRLCLVASAAAITTLTIAVPGATRHVPTSVLSVAVMVAALYLLDIGSMRRLRHVSRADFAISCTAFAGVVLFDALRGIALAVAMAAGLFVARSWKPHSTELVRVDRRKGYHDIARHPDGRRIPGLVIARFDAPLFFANATTFSRFVLDLVAAAPSPPRRVVVAAEPITDVDATAADELWRLIARLAELGVTVDLAEAKGPVKDRLQRYGLDVHLRTFPTIGTAVRAYLHETGTPWVDWEDRDGPSSGGVEVGPLAPAPAGAGGVGSTQSHDHEEAPMRAAVGDRIIVRGTHTGDPQRAALVLAVQGPDGGPPYLVRWDADEHESLFVPGADAVIEHLPEAVRAEGAER
jgi:MFS superfamily sulfate permease-like transporter